MSGLQLHSSSPIYVQIIEWICRQIARGERKSGEKLPSVRDLAIETGVNPNTVQRVYSELERMEVVYTRRGQGTFVTENEARIAALRQQLKQKSMKSFVSEMMALGFDKEQIIADLELFFRDFRVTEQEE